MLLLRPLLPVLLPLALVLQALSADAPHVPEAPCLLRSSVLPGAWIQLSPPNNESGPVWAGHLVVDGRKLLPFQLSQFQGYGSRIWLIPGDKDRGEYAIAFAKGEPVKAQTGAYRADAFLFPGLGSTLHARHDRLHADLSRAGEGFWQVGNGCRDAYLFGGDR